MLIGFFLFRKEILTEEMNKKLSSLIVQVTCPCIILNSVSAVPRDDPHMVLRLFLAGIIMYAIFPLIAYVLTGLMRVPAHLRGTYMLSLIHI